MEGRVAQGAKPRYARLYEGHTPLFDNCGHRIEPFTQ